MKIAVTGATGLIGTALCALLRERGHDILGITGGSGSMPAGVTPIPWDVGRGELDPARLEGVEAAVHLAGESVAGRWTASKKERIRSSREQGTRLLVDTLARVEPRPKVLVSASGVDFYGARGDEELDESSASGKGFLAEVCRIWEREASRAKEFGIRAASLRMGMVLSTRGGALAQMLLPFKLGLGGPVGSGKQWMSWVHIDDVTDAFRLVLEGSALEGPFNLTSPQPVRNAEFTKTLGKALGRPAFLPVPALGIKLLFGEMGEELLLSGKKVLPRALEREGYRFQHALLEPALEDLLASGK